MTSSAGPSLQTRGPAYSVLRVCLRIQDSARRPGFYGRLFGRSPLTSDARRWYRGALGEIQIAHLLSELGSGYTVFHNVRVGSDIGGFDIEHLVVGQTGVFAINTRNHSGQDVVVAGDSVTVNGHRTHVIADAAFEATCVARLLGAGAANPAVPVIPVIAIVDPGSLTITSLTAGVMVVSSRRLARSIAGRPQVLTPSDVTRIVSSASNAATWHPSVRPIYVAETAGLADSTNNLLTRFAGLHREVEAARKRRRAWATSAAVVAVSSILLPIMFSTGLLG